MSASTLAQLALSIPQSYQSNINYSERNAVARKTTEGARPSPFRFASLPRAAGRILPAPGLGFFAETANCNRCIDTVAQIRKSRRESGICTYCKEPSMAGFRYCKSHNKAEQRRRKKRLEDDALTIRSYTKAFLNRRASAGVNLTSSPQKGTARSVRK